MREVSEQTNLMKEVKELMGDIRTMLYSRPLTDIRDTGKIRGVMMSRQEAMKLMASEQYLPKKPTNLPGRTTPKEGERFGRKPGELSRRNQSGAEPAINIMVSGRETQ